MHKFLKSYLLCFAVLLVALLVNPAPSAAAFIQGSCADPTKKIEVDEDGEVDWIGYVKTIRASVPLYSSESTKKISRWLAFGKTLELLKLKSNRLQVQTLGSDDPLGWIEKGDLLCSVRPLRGKSGLEQKLFIKTPTQERSGKPATIKAYQSPNTKNCKGGCRELSRFNGYFIFAIDRKSKRYLLSDSYRLEEETTLVGWVDQKDGVIWDTAYGLRPREDLVFESGHKYSGQEKALCIYPSIDDAEDEKGCRPVLGGKRWYKIGNRIPIIGRDGDYFEVIVPSLSLGKMGPLGEIGYILDDEDVSVDVWLKSVDLTRWVSILDIMRDVTQYKAEEQREAFVRALTDAMQVVIRKPLYQDTNETLKHYFSRKGGLPVNDASPLLNWSLRSLMNKKLVPNCEIRRLASWLRNAKQMLHIVSKGDRRPVFREGRYPGSCRGGQNIPLIIGDIDQEPLGDETMRYDHAHHKMRIFWVPKKYLP